MPRFFKVNQIETNKPLKEWRRINKAKIGEKNIPYLAMIVQMPAKCTRIQP